MTMVPPFYFPGKFYTKNVTGAPVTHSSPHKLLLQGARAVSHHSNKKTPVRYQILSFIGLPTHRVGTDGSIWSKRIKGVVKKQLGPWWKMKGAPAIKGKYWCVNLPLELPYGRNKGRVFLVHRLVLEAFVGPCPEGMLCRHLDGNGRNNNLSNLCWGTSKENCEDTKRHGRTCLGRKFRSYNGEKHPNAALTNEQVIEIRKIYVKRCGEQTRLAKLYETTIGVIHNLVSGRTYKYV